MKTPGFIDILKIEDFRKLFLAQVISNFGDAITKIALAVFVYEKTGSAVSLSIVLLIQTLPRMVIGPIAGVLVDRLDRKAVLIASDVTRAILMSVLFGTTNVLQVYLIAFLHGTFSTMFTPARLAVLPEITGRTLYVKGISLTQMASQIIVLFGLSLGGTIVGLIGARTTFLLDAITFSASAGILFRTRIPKIAPKFPAASGRILSDFKEGLTFLSNQPVLRFLLWVYVLMASFGGMVGAVTLVYVKRSLHQGAYEYGILMASLSIGILMGSLLLGKYEHRTNRGTFLIGGALLRGLVYLPAYFTPPLGIMMTLWFTGGLVQAVVSIFGNAFFAEITPSEMRGRTYSVMNGVLSGVQLLPMYVAGLLAEAMKVSNVIALSGSMMLIGMLGLMTCSRGYQALRRYPVARI